MTAPGFAITAIALLGITCSTIYLSRKVKTPGDYFAGGRSFGWFFIAMNTLCGGIALEGPTIMPGSFSAYLVGGLWSSLLWLGALPFVWMIVPCLRRGRYLTSADYLRQRYGSSFATAYAAVGITLLVLTIGSILYITFTITEFLTGNAAVKTWTIILIVILAAACVAAGGLLTSTLTNSAATILTVLAIVALLSHQGGFSNAAEKLRDLFNPKHLDALGVASVTPEWILASSVTTFFGIVAHPCIMQIIATGKNEFTGRVGFALGVVLKAAGANWWMLVMLAAGIFISKPQTVFTSLSAYVVILSLFTLALSGITFCAIAASALLTQNIFKEFLRPFAADSQMLIVGKTASITVIFFGLLSAMLASTSLLQVFRAVLIISIMMGLPILGGFFWSRANAFGAFAAVAAPLTLFAVLGRSFIPEMLSPPGFMGFVFASGTIAFVIGSLFTAPPSKECIDTFSLLLKTPVGMEGNLVETGTPVVYTGTTDGHLWENKYPCRVTWTGAFITALLGVCFLGCVLFFAR